MADDVSSLAHEVGNHARLLAQHLAKEPPDLLMAEGAAVLLRDRSSRLARVLANHNRTAPTKEHTP